MTDHLDFDLLNDLADDRLPSEVAVAAWAHLTVCAPCRAVYDTLCRTVAAAATLPREIAVPPALWNDVRVRLAPRRRHVVGISHAGVAAAALLVVALSAAVTALVMQRDDTRRASGPSETVRRMQSPPARFAADERAYAESAARLEAMLAGRRDSLAPATVATVERSLRIADSAIAEARAALEHDPANRAIEAILASNYDRKIDLLRRATELSPRT